VRQLQKYAALPSADRWLLLSATFWLVFCRIALWILPFQDILRRIESMDGGAPTTANPAAAARIAWAVDAASRYVPGTGMCLPRALAAAVLLTRAGLPARLWVGVARGDGGRPEAHAWVESGDQVVIGGGELQGYKLISELKGNRSARITRSEHSFRRERS